MKSIRFSPQTKRRPSRRPRLSAERLEARDVPATATFQQDTNGYTGAFEVRIGSDIATNELGSANQNYFMDGPGGTSADQLDLIRFDNIVGAGPGQIPAGSVINSAVLVYSTSTVGNAQTAGPYGAARMLVPFDANTTYTSVPGGMPSQANGTFTRVDSAFVSGATIALPAGGTATARVTEHVQAWASGATNHGFAIRAGAGNTDGWSINTIGNTTVANRPLLSVDYTPPDLPLTTARFQQGVNGYADTVDVWLQSNNTTISGATLDQQFLDGGTPNDQMLIRFNNLFGAGAGQVPADATVLRAFLVITTGVATNAQSNGPYSVNRMLVDWTPTSTYIDSFGGDGPTEAQNEITPAVDNLIGFTPDGRNLFDITSVVDGWRTGTFPNFGLDVRANGTTDGWMAKFTGAPEADARPELVVLYQVTPPIPPATTLDIVGGNLTMTAGTGSPNNAVTLLLAGGNYTIADTGATIALTPAAIAAGWSGSGSNSVTGPDTSVSSLTLDLNQGSDTFALQGVNDTLTVQGGGQAADAATLPNAITFAGAVRITGFGTITQTAVGPLAISDLTLGAGVIGSAGSNILTAATTVTLLGGAGGVFLTESDGASVSFQATGAGDVRITNLAGDLEIDDTSFGGSGAIVITSDDGVAVNAPLGNANTSGTIAITANTDEAGVEGFSQGLLGSIQTTNTGDGQGGNPTAFSLTVNTAGGGTGNAAFGTNVSTGTGGLIAVDARGGNITMVGGTLRSGAGANGRITLNGVGIGVLANRIRTSAGNIASTAGNGGVFVEEVSDSPGSMQATATGAGDIYLFASSATNNGLIISGPVFTQSGNITLRADDDLIIRAPVGGAGFTGTVLCEASLDAVNEQVFRIDQDAGLGYNGSIVTENATASAVGITVRPTSVAAGIGGAILGNITVGSGGTIAVDAAVGTAAARAGRILQVAGTALNAGAKGTVNLVARDNSIGTATDPIRVTARTIVAATNSVATSPAPLQLPGDIFIVATGPASFAATTTTAAPNVGTISLTTESGALTINGATRTDSGSITLNGAAGLVLNGAIGGAGETGNLILNPGTGGTTQPGGSIVTAGGVLITGGAATLTQATNDLTTIAANLTGALSLADANAVATGAIDTTTGITATGTTVSGGRLNVLTGADVNGPVTATGGGTVGGTGTIVGALTANAQGTVSPGVSPGRLTVNGNVTFNANSTYAAELNGTTAGTDYDQLTANGTVSLGGATLALTLGFTPTVGNTFTIIDNDTNDAVIGAFAQGATVTAGGQAFTINYAGGSGNDVVLTHTGPATTTPRVTGTVVNGGAAQRSRVTEIAVTFSTQVTFATTAGAAFTLVRNSDSAAVTFTATANVVGGVTVVTLNTFGGAATNSGSLADGRYTLTALANQITAGGVQLDGNGDGTAGDDFTFGDAQGLFRFYGDLTGDRRVDISDFGFFSLAYLTPANYNAALDFNNDGRIDIADFGQFSVRYFTTLP